MKIATFCKCFDLPKGSLYTDLLLWSMAETLKIVLFHPFFKTLTIFYSIRTFKPFN